MKTLTLSNGKTFSIHFRYLSKYGKRPHFGKHTPFQALTICTVLADEGKFIAQDVAVCSSRVAPKPTPAMQAVYEDLMMIALVFEEMGYDEKIRAQLAKHIAKAHYELRPDQYSRREGRRIALLKTIERCGALRKIKDEFLDEYEKLDLAPLVRLRQEISDERKEELIALGQEGKEERRMKRRMNRRNASRAGVDSAAPGGAEEG